MYIQSNTKINLSKIEKKLFKDLNLCLQKYDKSSKILDIKIPKIIEKCDKLMDTLFSNLDMNQPFSVILIFSFPKNLSLNLRYKILKLVADLDFSFWSFDSYKFTSTDLREIINDILIYQIKPKITKNFLNYRFFTKYYDKKLFELFVNELKFTLKRKSSYIAIPKLKERFEICDLHLKNLDTFGQDPFYRKRHLYIMYKYIEFVRYFKENASKPKIIQKYFDIDEIYDSFLPERIQDYIGREKNLIPIDSHIIRSLYLLGFFDLFPEIKKLFEKNKNHVYNERDYLIYKLRGISKVILIILLMRLITNKVSKIPKINIHFLFKLMNNEPFRNSLLTGKYENIYFHLSKFMELNIILKDILFKFSKFSNQIYTDEKLEDLFKYDPTKIDIIKVDTINF